MNGADAYGLAAPRRSWVWTLGSQVLIIGLATVGAAVLAYLAAGGMVIVALAALLAVPLANFFLRHPQAVVAVWFAVIPFLVTAEGTWGAARPIFWVVHRGLPVIAVTIVVMGSILRILPRRLPRLGWPEAAMAGYLLVTVGGVLLTSDQVTATIYHVYDRVFIPMCLYLLVRLWQPDEQDLRRFVPIVAFLLVSQAVIGILSWTVPELVPSVWLNREGLRTTGSLRHPNVYGTTVLFAGLVLLHSVLNRKGQTIRRFLLTLLFVLSLVMVFLTYSRASWLAGVVVLLGLVALYPRFGTALLVVVTVAVVGLVNSGAIDAQVEMARSRFRSDQSEQSALSRLPVIHASIRMFSEKPVVGWGYGNFDRISPQFQRRVGGLIVPDKEHASHNLYLTLLSEQGLVGFVLYLFPPLVWLAASRRAWRHLPTRGVLNRKLLVMLWLVLASHVVVNNYSNMKVVVGLGVWWVTLGMIASLVTRYRIDREEHALGVPVEGPLSPRVALAGSAPLTHPGGRA